MVEPFTKRGVDGGDHRDIKKLPASFWNHKRTESLFVAKKDRSLKIEI